MILAGLFLVLILIIFAAAGTSDWQAEQAYQKTWTEIHQGG